jgi:CYTH domain-containing protein
MLAGDAGKYSKYEIERKFLLQKMPDDVPKQYVDIEDLYLPNSSLRLRIEKAPGGQILKRKLTKKDRDLERGSTTCVITSLYLSEIDLKALGPLEGGRLHKRRYALEDENNRITFDVFKGPLEGLILAEIEFLDDEACSRFKPNDSSWQEVTENPNYSGGRLAFLESVPNG